MLPSLSVKNLHVHLHMPQIPVTTGPVDLGELKSAPAANGPEVRFSKRSGGTVFDSATGLEWTADAISASSMSLEDAKKAVTESNVGGHSDWRLPTIQELLTLVDYERRDPAINTDFFTCKSSYYWSSTPYASSSDRAWLVVFSSGLSYWNLFLNKAFVRAVRAPSQ